MTPVQRLAPSTVGILVGIAVLQTVLPESAIAARPARAPAKPAALSMKEASALFQQTPSRVEVATSNGTQVLVTNAFTLERRNVLALADVRAVGFSHDGEVLHAFTASGDWHAIDPDKATAEHLGRVPLQEGEVVIDTLPVSSAAGAHAVGVVLAKAAPPFGTCATDVRMVAVSRGANGVVTTKAHTLPKRGERLAAGSPNTRFTAAAQGGALQLSGHFGAGSGKASTSPLPAGLFRISWQRDSAGLVGLFRRPERAPCTDRLGVRVWRRGESGWQEWTLPEEAEVVRGDIGQQEPEMASDGQRLLGWQSAGVFLIEPAQRFRGHFGQIAPASTVPPKIRPGVRPLATRYQGYARVIEQLLETGDLDAAETQLRFLPAADKQREPLQARLGKLQEVRLRRAREWQVPLSSLRSDKSAAEPPTPPEPDAPAPSPAPSPSPASAPPG